MAGAAAAAGPTFWSVAAFASSEFKGFLNLAASNAFKLPPAAAGFFGPPDVV